MKTMLSLLQRGARSARVVLLWMVLLVGWWSGIAIATPGDLDPSFGTGGKVTTDFGLSGGEDVAYAVTAQDDGKILTVGLSTAYACYPDPDYPDEDICEIAAEYFSFARFDSNGNLDTTFDGDGKKLIRFDSTALSDDIGYFGIYTIALQSDGKVVAAGEYYNENTGYSSFAVGRFNSNGSLDTNFGSRGMRKLILALVNPD